MNEWSLWFYVLKQHIIYNFYVIKDYVDVNLQCNCVKGEQTDIHVDSINLNYLLATDCYFSKLKFAFIIPI